MHLKRKEVKKKKFLTFLNSSMFCLLFEESHLWMLTYVLQFWNHSGFSFFELQSYLGKYLWLFLLSLTFPLKYIKLIKIYLYANNTDFAKQYETISYKQQENVILGSGEEQLGYYFYYPLLTLAFKCIFDLKSSVYEVEFHINTMLITWLTTLWLDGLLLNYL